ncbi:N-formylglutamate amidohydrolase [Formosa sediminum]|uniref:N-formylglutamate amidohydrolase n=1 Tax=Formosa sediminum TaxID=2594004 RepID=A0A516GQS8_9FLAO|nr:N-formylglutamate amidohydrolase [Formosa sediminum]QDO93843.1 N-formylglutamate amidohydrolase [Formosa sediminum]
MKLVLTCEHGGAQIPKRFESFFINEKTTLQTHRGFDLGALDVFKYLKPLADFSNFSETSRLLIELNRSLHHKNLFSEFTKTATHQTKQRLIDGYYLVYRNAVENYIKKQIDKGETVIHLSVHSFTPKLNGTKRTCDIGLLYDSSNDEESKFCNAFKSNLLLENPKLNIRFNYPYLGKSDGFTTALRKHFPEHYLGIELEINQAFAHQNAMPSPLKHQIYGALKSCLVR